MNKGDVPALEQTRVVVEETGDGQANRERGDGQWKKIQAQGTEDEKGDAISLGRSAGFSEGDRATGLPGERCSRQGRAVQRP